MNKIITASAVAFALAIPVAPAAGQSRVELQMVAQLQILQQQMQQIAITQDQLGKAIEAVNARMNQSDENTKTGFANQAQIIKNLATEVNVIREGTQLTGTSLGLLKDEIEAMRLSLTELPALLTRYTAPPPVPANPDDPNAVAAGGAGAPPEPGVEPAGLPPAPIPSTLGATPTRMYQIAYADYQSGQYSVAISGFESFLRQFPQTSLSDDAYVYLGESHFLQRQFDQAINAYTQAIQNFPTGDQIPLAYYKRGMAYSELKQYDQARASWEQVIKDYPNTAEAIAAKQGLDRISRLTPPPPAQ